MEYFDNAERLQPVGLSAELVRLGREIATTGECRYLACALLTQASSLTYYTDTEMPAIMAVIDEAAAAAATIDDGSFPPERFLQMKASVALACDAPHRLSDSMTTQSRNWRRKTSGMTRLN